MEQMNTAKPEYLWRRVIIAPVRRDFLICLFLWSAIWVVYGPVVGNDFINFDDPEYITENYRVRSGLSPENIRWALTAMDNSNWHPLTWLSHMLDVDLFGLDPGMHHMVSVLIHAANTLLLFYIFRKMTDGVWQSAFVAALFALHPLHVESVAWAAERKDLLSTFFGLAAIWRYSLYVSTPGIKKYAATLVYFMLSLMSKPMLVTLPFLFLLLDRWPLGRVEPDISNRINRSWIHNGTAILWVEKIPFFMLSALSSIITLQAQKSGSSVMTLDALPAAIRLAHTPVAYVGYIRKMIWPFDLGVFYPHPGLSPLWQVAGAAWLLATVSFFAIRFRKRYPFLLMGWLWVLGLLIPVIGLVQVGSQGLADRYTYMPLTGLFVMLAWGMPVVAETWSRRTLKLIICGMLLVIGLTAVSRQQTMIWQDSIKLYRHTLRVTSGNYSVHNNLGIAYENKGLAEEAIYHYTESLRIKPAYEKAIGNLGNILTEQGKTETAVALYRHALSIQPGSAKSHNNLAVALIKQDQPEKGMHHFKKALEIDPDYAKAHYNYGNALARMGRTDAALGHLMAAVRLNPFFAKAHNNLGVALAISGKPADAIPHYTKALRIEPEFAEAHNNLGIALVHMGEFEKATRHFEKAVALIPDFEDARINLQKIETITQKNRFRK